MPEVSPSDSAPLWTRRLPDFPRAVGWSADGELFAVGSDAGTVAVLRASDGKPLRTFALHEGGVTSLGFSPRAPLLATTGEDGRAVLLDLRTEQPRTLREGGSTWADCVVWNAKGSKLAFEAGRGAAIHTVDREAAVSVGPVESTITGLAWAPGGEQLAASCYGGVRLFDAKTGRRQRALDWKGSMLGVAWSPTAKVVACGCQDNSLHFWRLPAGKDSMMSGYPLKPKDITWSHDGKLLASSGAADVTVWRFEGKGPEGTHPLELSAHEEPITALTFSPIVTMLASGCKAGEIYLWAPDEVEGPVRAYRLPARIAHLAWGVSLASTKLILAATDVEGNVATWSLH